MATCERTAWISFISVALTCGVYLAIVASELAGGRHPPPVWIVGAVLALVVLQILLHGVAAARGAMRGDVDAVVPPDERDRIIELKATRAAFYVLISGAFLAIGTVHLGAHGTELSYAVFAAIVVAELVRSGGQVLGYRRGTW